MINLRDEIMVRLAVLLNKEDEDLPFADPEDVREYIPFATPEEVRELEPSIGSANWMADNHPYAYLFGNMPYRGFVNSPKYDGITTAMMNKLVKEYPEKYFEWGLRRINKVKPWKTKAAKALIERDPEKALVLDITLDDELTQFIPVLWNRMVSKEAPELWQKFPGILHVRMRSLLRRIKDRLPSVYNQLVISQSDLVNTLEKGPVQLFPSKDKDDSPRGSEEWMAERYKKTYLRGVDVPGAVHVYQRDFYDFPEKVIWGIVNNDPAKYFTWGLRRQESMYPYLRAAAKSLIEKSPYDALVLRIYKEGPEVHDLLPELWVNMIKSEGERTEKEYERFPGVLYNHMRSLAMEISRTNREFFDNNIKETAFARQRTQ